MVINSPNQLENDKPDRSSKGKDGDPKRPGAAKNDKTATFEVDEIHQIQPQNIISTMVKMTSASLRLKERLCNYALLVLTKPSHQLSPLS